MKDLVDLAKIGGDTFEWCQGNMGGSKLKRDIKFPLQKKKTCKQ